jgi:LysM repeat protein
MRTWKLLLISVVAVALFVPATASASFMHVVAPGESLYSVAATDGLSVDQLAAANGLSPNSSLIAGSSLAIPPQGGGTTSATTYSSTPSSTTTYASTEQPASSTGGYVVQPGDTLSAIAARAGVSVDQLAAANGLNPNGILLAGSTLSGAGGSSSASGSTSSTEYVSTSPTSQSSSSPSSSGAQPTSEFVSPSEVGSIASMEGVPPSLAEAIGYQESGFNNSEVSPTGAVGVMQIEPGTWHYIGQNLAGPPPLQPASASDNVRAGTLLLHSLLNQTGGNAAMTAAAYYQGLPSIQAHGILPSTQQYVKDVMSLQSQFGGG